MNNDNLPVAKSEILFLYESTYSIPNGDPFTGEQRYDEETKKVLVSDVRIKRFIRDYLAQTNPNSVYVLNDSSLKSENKDPESGASARFNALFKGKKGPEAVSALTTLTDVRLFGGILTQEKNAVNLTGPVQFALLNPSLNAVDLRMHQNTSVFVSSTKNTQGTIGTTTIVPYALNQIHGWINPYSARHTNLTPEDIQLMFRALWNSVNNANTRTKSNQASLLLLQVVYTDPTKKLYGLDRAIRLIPTADKREEQIRNREDYALSYAALQTLAESPFVQQVRYYTEDKVTEQELQNMTKFSPLTLGA